MLDEILQKALDPILVLGIVGQLIFATRFLLQWIVSERRGESVIPVAFWWVSIVGGTMTLVYGVLATELPVIMGQLFTNVIYVRNLKLIYRKRRLDAAAAAAE